MVNILIMFTVLSNFPTKLPEPYLWLRTDHTASLVLVNNTTCSRWDDWRTGMQSGLTGSATRSPYFVQSGYLGKPALRFDSGTITTGDYLEATDGSIIDTFMSNSIVKQNSGWTYAFATYCNRISGSRATVMALQADETPEMGLTITNAGSLKNTLQYQVDDATYSILSKQHIINLSITSSALVLNVMSISSSVWNRIPNFTGSILRNNATAVFRNNGFYVGNSTALTQSRNLGDRAWTVNGNLTDMNTASSTYKPVRFGIQRIATNTFNQWDGEMYEFLLWQRPLSDSEITAVISYLERWK